MPLRPRLFILFGALGAARAVLYRELCNSSLIHTPFQPAPKIWSQVTDEDIPPNMTCWWYADCIYREAPETRKQQYAAAAFIMGLLPLIVKDVTWPHRRIAYVPEQLAWPIEIVVRAFGVVPTVKSRPSYGRKFSQWASWTILVICIALEATSLTGFALLEASSKRSALKCTFPAFILLWQFLALVPAVVEVITSRGLGGQWKWVSFLRFFAPHNALERDEEEDEDSEAIPARAPLSTSITAVPGAEDMWWVQLFWGVYYTTGTLFYTSIMIVTVVELVVWVLLSFLAAAVGKMLAYRLCGYWAQGWKTKSQ